MLNKTEQTILIYLLKKGSLSRKTQNFIKSMSFYTIMKRLEEEELIFNNCKKINGTEVKFYFLTEFGSALAKFLSKLSSTPKEYQNERIVRFKVWFE